EAAKKHIVTAVAGDLPKTNDNAKYDGLTISARVVGWVVGDAVVRSGALSSDAPAALLLDQTNFYAESGGQVGDAACISTPTGCFDVEDTQKLGDAVLHFGQLAEGIVEVGQAATLTIAEQRLDTMRNHTSTHIMNWALREVLGDSVEQKGSLVDADKTRF